MIRLLADPDLVARMGVVARIHARRYSWQAAADCLTSLYERLLGTADGESTAPLDLHLPDVTPTRDDHDHEPPPSPR